MNNQYEKFSRYLSLILRHKAIDMNIEMDSQGYVLVSDILKLGCKINDKLATINDIKNVVENNDKKRFSLLEKNNELYIRANQGHSNLLANVLNDDEMLEEIKIPLSNCIHGTYKKFLDSIQKNGLNKMTRKHIHFTTNIDKNTVISGMRSSCQVAIFIDMQKAMNDNIKFYKSSNNVILCEGPLDPKYFKTIKILV